MTRRMSPRRPSPALVIAVLALVAALTGTAVAEVATTARLDKKEKKQVRKIAKKIAKKQAAKAVAAEFPIEASQLADGAVNAAKVQNGALGTGEFSSSIPAAHVTRTSPQSIPNGTVTTLGFNSERYDTAAMHNNATNNSRLTAPVTGIYAVTAQVEWDSNMDGGRNLALEKNGVENPLARASTAPSGDVPVQQEVTTQVRLQAGDFVRAQVEQSSSGFLDVVKDPDYTPEFSMTWLAPGP